MRNLFKKLFKIHEHDRKLFCTGKYALVYCRRCGAESIPWEVSEEKAKAWHESHPKAWEEYLADKKRSEETK